MSTFIRHKSIPNLIVTSEGDIAIILKPVDAKGVPTVDIPDFGAFPVAMVVDSARPAANGTRGPKGLIPVETLILAHDDLMAGAGLGATAKKYGFSVGTSQCIREGRVVRLERALAERAKKV